MDKNLHFILISDNENYDLFTNDLINRNSKYAINHKIFLWNKAGIDKCMTDNKDYEILNLMNSIIPYAFQADLAKLYIVYHYGGWYSDITNSLQQDLNLFEGHDFIGFSDRGFDHVPWAICSGLFYANKKHPVIKKALDMVLENIKNKYIGKHILASFGPVLFGSAIASLKLPKESNYYFGEFKPYKDLQKNYFMSDGTIFCKYKTLEPGDVGIPGTNNYNKMFLENQPIYR